MFSSNLRFKSRVPGLSFAFAALVVVLAAVSITGCGGPEVAEHKYEATVSHIEVSLAEVETRPLQNIAEFTGTLLPRRLTMIMAEVEGVISEIPQIGARIQGTVNGRTYDEQLGILPGQAVKKGDVLLKIDPRQFEVELAIAEAREQKAIAELENLKAWSRSEVVTRLEALQNEANARYRQAVNDHERQQRLMRSNAISQSELEQTRMALDSASAALESANAEFAQSQTGPTPQEIAVKQAVIDEMEAEVESKKLMLEKTVLKAPYDGVVTAFNIEVGNNVSPAVGPLVELIDNRFLVAEVGVPEIYLNQINVYDRGEVFATGAVEPSPGIVVGINEKVEPETRTYRLRIAIDNQVANLKAGQFARIKIPLVTSEGGRLTVPSKAIVFVEGQPNVFVFKDGKVTRTAIDQGLADETMTEVLSGLTAGQQVVVDDPNLLTDGLEVTVRGENEAQATRK